MSYSPEELSEQFMIGLSRATLPKTRINIIRRLIRHEVGMPAVQMATYKREKALHRIFLGIVQDAADGLTLRGRVRRWRRHCGQAIWGR